MIESTIAIIGIVVVVLWFMNGVLSSRLRDKDQEIEAHEDVRFKDAEADRAGRDSDLDKRVREKYRNR